MTFLFIIAREKAELATTILGENLQEPILKRLLKTSDAGII
jgi:hypothetical protein